MLETNSVTVQTIHLIIPKLFRACTVPGNDQVLFIAWYGEPLPVHFEFINKSNQTEKWIDYDESFNEMVYNICDIQQGASPIQRHSEICFMEISYIMKWFTIFVILSRPHLQCIDIIQCTVDKYMLVFVVIYEIYSHNSLIILVAKYYWWHKILFVINGRTTATLIEVQNVWQDTMVYI